MEIEGFPCVTCRKVVGVGITTMSPQACASSLVQTICSGHAWNLLPRESVNGIKQDYIINRGHKGNLWIIFLEIGNEQMGKICGSNTKDVFHIWGANCGPEGLIPLRHLSGETPLFRSTHGSKMFLVQPNPQE